MRSATNTEARRPAEPDTPYGPPEVASRLIKAGQIVDELGHALSEGESAIRVIPKLVKAVLVRDLWRERVLRTGELAEHRRFADFVSAPPLEGLGEDPETIKKLLRDDPEALALFEEAMVGRPGNPTGANQHSAKGGNRDIRTDSSEAQDRGTTRGYTLRRLKRDHPALFSRVVNGELSAHRAAIEAGFRGGSSVHRPRGFHPRGAAPVWAGRSSRAGRSLPRSSPPGPAGSAVTGGRGPDPGPGLDAGAWARQTQRVEPLANLDDI